MVKLGFYLVKTTGKKLGPRQYEEVSLRFPVELHEFLRSLRYRELDVKASREGNVTHILLTDKNLKNPTPHLSLYSMSTNAKSYSKITK